MESTVDILVYVGINLGLGISLSAVMVYSGYRTLMYLGELYVLTIVKIGKTILSRLDSKKLKNRRPGQLMIAEWNEDTSNRRFRMQQWIRGYEAAMHGEKLENYLAVEGSANDLDRIARTAFVDGYRYYALSGGDEHKGEPIVDFQDATEHRRLMIS